MLAGRQILKEDFQTSPWLRRRPEEHHLVYQLMVRASDPIERILNRLGENRVDAIDLNLACDAMSIRACEAGSALFDNLEALREVLEATRRHWPHLLAAKIRLGGRGPDWQPRFIERLKLLEDAGVDVVTLHPRFFEDKFKRRARHELIAWAASLTRMPLIANGDLDSPGQVDALAAHLRPACGIMIGRMAIVRPWIFAAWDAPVAIDHAAVWRKMHRYCIEDFPPAVALRRIQMFTKYFAANFAFGHQFHVSVANAVSIEEALLRGEEFLARNRMALESPSVAGL
jgi:tRNA-dihydrouridine synthase